MRVSANATYTSYWEGQLLKIDSNFTYVWGWDYGYWLWAFDLISDESFIIAGVNDDGSGNTWILKISPSNGAVLFTRTSSSGGWFIFCKIKVSKYLINNSNGNFYFGNTSDLSLIAGSMISGLSWGGIEIQNDAHIYLSYSSGVIVWANTSPLSIQN